MKNTLRHTLTAALSALLLTACTVQPVIVDGRNAAFTIPSAPAEAASPAAPLIATLGEARPLAADWLGVNANLSYEGEPWSDAGLLDAFQELGARNLRYPGGGIANYWDWEIGWVEQEMDEGLMIGWMRGMQASPHRYTLDNLAIAYDTTGATVVFVLNLITSDLDEQLDALHRAEALGIPIERVELGNEFYIDDFEPLVIEKYPTSVEYAEDANRWAAAIKADFPKAQVAVIGHASDSSRGGSRSRGWNQGMLPLLSSDIDAVTIHTYANAAVGPRPQGGTWADGETQQRQYELLQTRAGAARMIGEPFVSWQKLQRFSFLPDELGPDNLGNGKTERTIWLTEFNLFDRVGPARHSWAHGLYVAGFLHNFLRDERIEIVSYHNLIQTLFGAVVVYDYFDGLDLADAEPVAEPYSLTASGHALSLFARASREANSAAPLIFSPLPLIEPDGQAPFDPYPALFGWSFSQQNSDSPSDNISSLLLINLDAVPPNRRPRRAWARWRNLRAGPRHANHLCRQ